VPISTSIDVDRSAARLFEYVTDPIRFSEWQTGLVEGHMETSGPPSVGEKCFTTRRMGFADRHVTSEVTHIDPPHSWGVRGIDGPIRAAVDVTVEPLENDQRSKVTITIDFTGLGIGKLLVPLLVRPQARREMPANVQRLKARLEAIDHPTND
jgi:hypothetical protein